MINILGHFWLSEKYMVCLYSQFNKRLFGKYYHDRYSLVICSHHMGCY